MPQVDSWIIDNADTDAGNDAKRTPRVLPETLLRAIGNEISRSYYVSDFPKNVRKHFGDLFIGFCNEHAQDQFTISGTRGRGELESFSALKKSKSVDAQSQLPQDDICYSYSNEDEIEEAPQELNQSVGQRPSILLSLLTDTCGTQRRQLVCETEITRFDPHQRDTLLPLLWDYILVNRDSNDRDELVAVGSAIRKYVALIPMERMGELAELLESGHRSPLPVELEIEVAKMIYRNFEVHPPAKTDTQPQLAQRLWEIVEAYINPRVLLRDRHSAATSLAIEAIVAMRSPLAEKALRAAHESPYRWFAEIISDDLDELRDRWGERSQDAVTWLDDLRQRIETHV